MTNPQKPINPNPNFQPQIPPASKLQVTSFGQANIDVGANLQANSIVQGSYGNWDNKTESTAVISNLSNVVGTITPPPKISQSGISIQNLD